MRRHVLVAAALAALLTAPSAVAKIWFTSVGGKTYPIGASVTTTIVGCSMRCPVAGAQVAFARNARVNAPPPSRPLTRPLGTVDRRGVVRFVVPKIAAGRYRLAARPRGGRWYWASGTFVVEHDD